MNTDIITKVLNNSATDEEITALFAWVEESEDHKKLFSDIQNTWALVSMVSPEQAEQKNQFKFNMLMKKIRQHEKMKSQIHDERSKHLWVEIRRYAAIIVITMGISGLITYGLVHKSPAPAGMHQLKVPSGQQAELTLDDGTKIWLNAK